MSDVWREFLYPLGFLSAIAFGSRVIIQWLISEAKGKSSVTPIFWRLSIFGNVFLALHAFIQMQFHVCLIQACSTVISWRNLNLMQPLSRRVSTSRTISILLTTAVLTALAFAIQGYLSFDEFHDWFRIPIAPWQSGKMVDLSYWWHGFGFVGIILFSSRFWLQWWCAERDQESHLGASFWWVSLVGESICLIYFLRINDPVNFIGPLCALIPYVRNLVLIYRPRQKQQV